jgi:hypothetical protein
VVYGIMVGAEGSQVTRYSSIFHRRAFSWFMTVQVVLLIFAMPVWSEETDRSFIPLDEITPGMTGYGLTVFEGSRIDTFGVRVVGVQPHIRADGSLLVIEVSGHGLEISSIAQGMSGSPVYLDGRFAGALAFGWGGALKPYAGVTPAAEILALPTAAMVVPEASRRGLAPDLQSLIPVGFPDEGLTRCVLSGEMSDSFPIGDGPPDYSDPAIVTAWPEPRDMILNLLADAVPAASASLPGPGSWIVQPVGHTGQAAGEGAQAPGPGPVFQPGSACAVPLITGDAKLGAIGTVTWVEGDQVFMMGHPFMQRGPVDWPLATAEILTVFPSRQMSFKIGSVGHIVGTVHHDQRAGLSGQTGPVPSMVPVSVELEFSTTATSESRSYEFLVVDDERLTPTLVFWSLYNSLLVQGDDASAQTLSYRIETLWEGPSELADEPLVLSGVTAGPGGAMGLAAEWMAPLNILLNNPHEKVRLKEVRAHLAATRPMSTATITGVTGPRSLPATGGEVVFRVDLQPRQGKPETLEIPLVLPAHLEAGPYRILVASAAELFAFEAQRASGRFQVSSLGGILDILRTDRSQSTLVVALLAPGGNLVLLGQEMHNLPGSVAALIRSGNMQASRTLADYMVRGQRPTAWALAGFAVRALQLKPTPEPFKEERRP